jgi:hypothetical protein
MESSAVWPHDERIERRVLPAHALAGVRVFEVDQS